MLEPTPRTSCSTEPRRVDEAGIENIEPLAAQRPPASSSTTRSPLDLQQLLDDPRQHRRATCARYIDGFSATRPPGVRQVRVRHADRPPRPREPALPGDRHGSPTSTCIPTACSNHEMGYIFEELIRKFAELSNETAGEHFTPREVIRLMVNLLFVGDERRADRAGRRPHGLRPACGTGGMLSEAEDQHPRAEPGRPARDVRPGAEPRVLRDLPGRHADQGPGRRATSSSATRFSDDGHVGKRFDYMLSNPPFGVEWKKVESEVARGARRRSATTGASAPACRASQRRPAAVPAAPDLEDAAGRRSGGSARSPSSSTARRCSPAAPSSGE